MTQGHQQYRVLERLAAGGMAEVFLAERVGLEGFKKRVAIKRVLPHLSQKTRFIAMFLDEARVSAYLTHSNVAQVFDIGVGENAYFIVMEYVEGADLKSVMEFMRKTGRSFPVEVSVHIAEKMCEGLSYAHEAKTPEGEPLCIVHRDVSPPNVLITKYGEVKIVDFGLAKATSQLEKSDPGIVKGKFSYLSPEAAQGQDVDARADVFAAGIILWEMLSQKRLFLGENDARTVMLVRSANIPPLGPLNKDVPPELDRIIAKALARDPDKRYATARDFGRDLTTFLFKYGKPVSSHEVGEMVRNTVASRKPATKAKPTTVGKLIEEALLEFKSLEEDESAEGGTTSERLMRGRVSHFEDIAKWIEEIEANPASEARSARPVFGRRRTFEPISTRAPLSSRGPGSVRAPAPAPASDAAPQATADEVPMPTIVAPIETSTDAPEREAVPPPAHDDSPPNTRRSVPPTSDSAAASGTRESQPIVIHEPSQPMIVKELLASVAVKESAQAVTIKEMFEPVVVKEISPAEMSAAASIPTEPEESHSPSQVEESEPLETGDISRPVGGKKRKKKSDKKDGDRSSRIELEKKERSSRIELEKKERSSRIEPEKKERSSRIELEKKERSSRIETALKSSKRVALDASAKAKDESSNKAIWIFVVAALLLLGASGYYGGLFGH
jgi:serine/threonine-protein kinase